MQWFLRTLMVMATVLTLTASGITTASASAAKTSEPVNVYKTFEGILEWALEFVQQLDPRIQRSEDEPDTADHYDEVRKTDIDGKTVALTFDDGPSPYTHEILDILNEYDVKATFCVIGQHIQEYPEVLQRIISEGHELCNHTMYHAMNMNTWSTEDIIVELEQTDDVIANIVGKRFLPVYYRAPGGMFSENMGAALEHVGMRIAYWSVDPRDWAQPGVESIVSTVTSEVEPQGIVLLHDGGGNREQTVQALPQILDYLEQEEYDTVFLRPEGFEE